MTEKAFPETTWRSVPPTSTPRMFPATEGGMSLRDYFAAHAPLVVITDIDEGGIHERVARWAYGYADAMLRIREGS